MGKNNSSKFCVRPLMNEIGKDKNKIAGLLGLMDNGIQQWNITQDIGTIEKIFYDSGNSLIKEIGLPPTEERLIWLINNFNEENKEKTSYGENETGEKRKTLSQKDNGIIVKEAIQKINSYKNPNKWPQLWWVLEGSTKPDIFIETDKYIFVGEAKFTESHLTKEITWDKQRVQLVRHIEGAVNYEEKTRRSNKERRVISFYIIDEDRLKNYQKDLDDTKKGENCMWDSSLRHFELGAAE